TKHYLRLSPYSLWNIVWTLCIYTGICKHEGSWFVFSGSKKAWEVFTKASDADLIAEQEIWAAVDPYAKKEAFNCSNTDFGIQEYGFEEGTNVGMMKEKKRVWEAMMKENQAVFGAGTLCSLPATINRSSNWAKPKIEDN
ncbi:unnamed protein product, partial [Eruca vesicaria subsp. sativa]|nr:unnamed protein product [Eruca vesicaria subsp. sativa]